MIEININVPEEMQIVAAIQERIRKLKNMSGDHSNQIEASQKVLEKIKQANCKQAEEIMRSEG